MRRNYTSSEVTRIKSFSLPAKS